MTRPVETSRPRTGAGVSAGLGLAAAAGAFFALRPGPSPAPWAWPSECRRRGGGFGAAAALAADPALAAPALARGAGFGGGRGLGGAAAYGSGGGGWRRAGRWRRLPLRGRRRRWTRPPRDCRRPTPGRRGADAVLVVPVPVRHLVTVVVFVVFLVVVEAVDLHLVADLQLAVVLVLVVFALVVVVDGRRLGRPPGGPGGRGRGLVGGLRRRGPAQARSRLDVAELGRHLVPGHQLAGADVELPAGLLGPAPRPVGEADHPHLVVQLVGGPRPVEHVVGDPGAPVEQVPRHRLVEALARGRPLGVDVDERAGQLHHLGLLGEDRHREALDPLHLDVGLLGHVLHRPTGPQPGLHLPGREQAPHAGLGTRPGRVLASRPHHRSHGRAIGPTLGLGDRVEDLGVEGDDVAARVGAPAAP